VSFKSFGVVSYSPSIVVSGKYSDFLVENGNTAPVFSAPAGVTLAEFHLHLPYPVFAVSDGRCAMNSYIN